METPQPIAMWARIAIPRANPHTMAVYVCFFKLTKPLPGKRRSLFCKAVEGSFTDANQRTFDLVMHAKGEIRVPASGGHSKKAKQWYSTAENLVS